jgi:hypothetical protein
MPQVNIHCVGNHFATSLISASFSIPTLIIPLECILDQVYPQHIILTIFLLILAILARITNEAFTIVDHIFLCEIDECI